MTKDYYDNLKQQYVLSEASLVCDFEYWIAFRLSAAEKALDNIYNIAEEVPESLVWIGDFAYEMDEAITAIHEIALTWGNEFEVDNG